MALAIVLIGTGAGAVPPDDSIRRILAGRAGGADGVGIVVGIVEPRGRRIVTHGGKGRFDGDTEYDSCEEPLEKLRMFKPCGMRITLHTSFANPFTKPGKELPVVFICWSEELLRKAAVDRFRFEQASYARPEM